MTAGLEREREREEREGKKNYKKIANLEEKCQTERNFSGKID